MTFRLWAARGTPPTPGTAVPGGQPLWLHPYPRGWARDITVRPCRGARAARRDDRARATGNAGVRAVGLRCAALEPNSTNCEGRVAGALLPDSAFLPIVPM